MSEPTAPDGAVPIWSRWSHLWQPWTDLLDPSQPHRMASGPKAGSSMARVWAVLLRDYRDLVDEPAAPEILYDREATEELLRRVRRHAPSGQTFNAMRKTLEVLDAGNRLGRWHVAIPYLPAPRPPAPASYFQAASFELMARHQSLFDRFVESLASEVSEEVVWGRLLTSAVLYGGLLQPKWLGAVPAAVETAPAHCYWLELEYAPESGKPAMHTRWYPDPLTRYLLICQRKRGAPAAPGAIRSAREAFRVIRQYATACGFADALPRNWSELRAVVSTRLALYVPSYVVGYLRGDLPATSVPATVGERLRQPPQSVLPESPPSMPQRAARRGETSGGDDRDDEAGDGALEQVRSLAGEIRRRRARGDPDRIARWREQRSARRNTHQPLLPSVRRLAEWVEWLLRSRHAHAGVSPRTAYERYNAIAQRLVGQLGDLDPAQFAAPEDFVELYATAIEDAVEHGHPGRVRRGLHSFHTYLASTYSEVPDVTDAGLFRADSGSAPDPNLIGWMAFESAMNVVRHTQPWRREEADVMILIASLGYYGGLRRSEALGLRICDIEAAPDNNVLVQSTEDRRLKSYAARRLIPFAAFAPHDTQWLLMNWYERRCDHSDVSGPTSQARLFALPGRGPIRDNDPLFETITGALARVTHDPGIRFHHLRHSFASALLLSLWEAQRGRPAGRAHHLPGLVDVDPLNPTNVGVQRALHRELLGTSKIQRRTLRVVALLMGHSGVDVTLRHYVHTLDYVAGLALRCAIPDLSRRAIAAATGYSEPRVHALAREFDAPSTADLLEQLGDQLLPGPARAVQRNPEDEPEPHDWTMAKPDSPLECLKLLARAVNEHHAPARRQRHKQRYPWSWGKLIEVAEFAEREVPRCARKRPRGVTERLIDLPLGDREWRLAERAVDALRARSLDERLALAADSVKRRVDGPPLALCFERLPALKRWLRFLDALGVVDTFDLEHYPQRASKVGSADTQRNYWARGCARAVAAAGEPGTRAGARGEIVVRAQRTFHRKHGASPYPIQWALTMSYLAEPENCSVSSDP